MMIVRQDTGWYKKLAKRKKDNGWAALPGARMEKGTYTKAHEKWK